MRGNYLGLKSSSRQLHRNLVKISPWTREPICENRSMHHITATTLTKRMAHCWNTRHRRRRKLLRICLLAARVDRQKHGSLCPGMQEMASHGTYQQVKKSKKN